MTEEKLNQPPQIKKPRKISVLRQLREKAGLTREQLVARLDNRVALKTLQRWETSGKEPAMTREDWLDLCDALNVRWEELPRNLAGFVEEEQGVTV
jgi:DNA-binding transcriptional regulator YiaG